MTLGQGQLFASGMSILLKGPNDPLPVPDGTGPVKYLHFVDAAGNTIVPTYEADGVDTGSGKLAGARLVVASGAEVVILQLQVAALQLQALTRSEIPFEQAWAEDVTPTYTTSRVVRVQGEEATNMNIETPSACFDGHAYTLIVKKNSTFTATFAGGWRGNGPPSLSGGANDQVMIVEFRYDSGTPYITSYTVGPA